MLFFFVFTPSIYFWYTDNNLISKALSAHPIPFRSSSLVLLKHDHKSLSIQQWASKGLFRNIFDEISSAWMSKTSLFWTSVTHSSCRFFRAQSPLWRPQVVPCSDKLLNSQTINDIYSSMTDNWFSMVSEGELCAATC